MENRIIKTQIILDILPFVAGLVFFGVSIAMVYEISINTQVLKTYLPMHFWQIIDLALVCLTTTGTFLILRYAPLDLIRSKIGKL